MSSRCRSTRARSTRSSPSSPDWLAADRRAAYEAWSALPGESNLLYTPYIDLRAAQLEAAAFATDHGTERGVGTLPDDADGLIEFDEGRVVAVALSAAAEAAGVVLRPLLDDVDAVRDLLDGGPSLPSTDKFAQLTRALWSQGVLVDVPAGVRLERPIVVRWAVGAPDRALVTRSLDPARRRGRGLDRRGARRIGAASGAVRRAARRSSPARPRSRSGPAHRSRSRASRSSATTPSRSSIGTRRSVRAPRCSGPSRSSVAGSCAAVSRTGWSATEARSSRSRSCSAPTSSCST